MASEGNAEAGSFGVRRGFGPIASLSVVRFCGTPPGHIGGASLEPEFVSGPMEEASSGRFE